MKARKIVLLVIGLALLLVIAIPVTVAALTQGDALAGLTEYYDFLVDLAKQGLNAYVEFLEAL